MQVEVRHPYGTMPRPPEVEAAAREMVQHAHLLDQPERIVEGQAVDARPEADAARALRRGGEEDAGHGREAERRRVMLGEVIRIEARRVVLLEQPQAALVVLGHGHVTPVEMVEDSQIHGAGKRTRKRVWRSGRGLRYHDATIERCTPASKRSG
jgi:hypothetical protein